MLNLSHGRLQRFGGVGVVMILLAASAASAQLPIDPRIRNLIDEAPPLATDQDGSVLEGLRLFLEEQFGGNGRVCASCHPATNNFTIDPAFIRTLPPNDPLFVAEFNPDLRDLERPRLMRRLGLILENLDGFDQPGVMRGVPHTLGLSQSIAPDQGNPESNPPRPPFPLDNMTGWSGDGAPNGGSLLQFGAGAVAQHFTKTLARTPCSTDQFNQNPTGCDFRVPTSAELRAMEAFQLFLGRHEEINIEPHSLKPNEIVFRHLFVEDGKMLFQSAPGRQPGTTRSCNGCHNNAGANDANGNGRMFATGANFHPNMPACRLPGEVPGDGGFGPAPVTTVSGREFCGTQRDFDITYRGTLAMNTPSLIEAADTGPFFHNNIVNTIEQAVEFYTTDVFNASPTGNGNAFVLDKEEINKIAAMLRVLNALHNIQNGNRLDRIAQRQASVRPRIALLAVQIAISETRDAIQVLSGAPVALYPGTDILNLLRRARNLEQRAVDERNPSLLDTAIQLKNQARDQMIVLQ